MSWFCLHNFGLKKNFVSSKARPITNFLEAVLKKLKNLYEKKTVKLLSCVQILGIITG